MAEQPERIVVTDSVFGEVARLSYSLAPDTRFVLTKTPATFTLPKTDTALFVYTPSPALIARLERLGNTLRLLYSSQEQYSNATTLYRLMLP